MEKLIIETNISKENYAVEFIEKIIAIRQTQ
jgi:hypothetical protein